MISIDLVVNCIITPILTAVLFKAYPNNLHVWFRFKWNISNRQLSSLDSHDIIFCKSYTKLVIINGAYTSYISWLLTYFFLQYAFLEETDIIAYAYSQNSNIKDQTSKFK